VLPEQEADAARVERRMLRVSIAGHIVSALLLASGAVLFSQPLAWAFSALFLLSTLFRPGVEYYRYLRRKLSDLLADVTYPRDDVQSLVAEVRSHGTSLVSLRQAHDALEREALARDQAQQRKLDAVVRRFDETLDRLTDNREIVAGLRAFLRMVREPTPLE
jgi:transposase-like protein